jgi:hypothetical protein
MPNRELDETYYRCYRSQLAHLQYFVKSDQCIQPDIATSMVMMFLYELFQLITVNIEGQYNSKNFSKIIYFFKGFYERFLGWKTLNFM